MRHTFLPKPFLGLAAAALLLAATAALLVRHLRTQWQAVYGG